LWDEPFLLFICLLFRANDGADGTTVTAAETREVTVEPQRGRAGRCATGVKTLFARETFLTGPEKAMESFSRVLVRNAGQPLWTKSSERIFDSGCAARIRGDCLRIWRLWRFLPFGMAPSGYTFKNESAGWLRNNDTKNRVIGLAALPYFERERVGCSAEIVIGATTIPGRRSRETRRTWRVVYFLPGHVTPPS